MIDYHYPQFWDFVHKHVGENPQKLLLRYSSRSVKDGFDYKSAILQIQSRNKYRRKLADTLERCPDFFFPDALSGEQCSSDVLAAFHAGLIPGTCMSAVDLTAGLGIDVLHLCRKGLSAVACEMKEELARALSFNADKLNLAGLTSVIPGDSTLALTEGKLTADVVFADPARRGDHGQRLFSMEDCQPSISVLMPQLRKFFKYGIFKLSPMLDLSSVVKSLGNEVTDVYSVGTLTQCSEVVVCVTFGKPCLQPVFHAVALSTGGEQYRFDYDPTEEAALASPVYGMPQKGDYVFEPGPVVMKAGPFKSLAKEYGLNAISANTHVLWASAEKNSLPGETFFPGTVHRVRDIIPWQSKEIKRLKNQYPKLQVAVRNFGMSAQDLQRKLAVKDGDDHRLLAITDALSNRHLLILESI